MKVDYYTLETKELQKKGVPSVFCLENINHHLIWEAITAENANLRQGTHKTKSRAEVRGGGRKPWKQKGTGNARAGSTRSPVWVGGGTAFGPVVRSYKYHFSRKKKRVAYKNIIAYKLSSGKVMLLDRFDLPKVSTSSGFQLLSEILYNAPFKDEYFSSPKVKKYSNDHRANITVVVEKNNIILKQSLKNIPWVTLIQSDRLSARKIFYNHGLFFTENAFEHVASLLGKPV